MTATMIFSCVLFLFSLSWLADAGTVETIFTRPACFGFASFVMTFEPERRQGPGGEVQPGLCLETNRERGEANSGSQNCNANEVT